MKLQTSPATDSDRQGRLRQELIARGLVPDAAIWSPLSGGRTNLLWRVRWPGQDVVCKSYPDQATGNPLFPNDPSAEYLILTHLAEHDISPTPRHLVETPAGSCLVYGYVAGGSWRHGVAPVARLLARLHGLPAQALILRNPSGSAALRAQTRNILARCSSAFAALLHDLCPVAFVSPADKLRLVHGDVVPNNLLVTETGLILIDWQCPAIADPCEDLAIFLSPAMQILYRGSPLSPEEKGGFLTAYSCPRIVARYHLLAPYFHWRMAAYCLWKSEQGAADYALAMMREIAALRQLTG